MGKLLDYIKDKMDIKSHRKRMDERFENGVQVAAAPLAEKLTKIGGTKYIKKSNGKVAFNTSPRDIIRNDIGYYPYTIVERSVKNGREKAPYLLHNGKGETFVSEEPINSFTHPFAFKKNGELRKGYSIEDNRSDFRKGFDDAFNAVRSSREMNESFDPLVIRHNYANNERMPDLKTLMKDFNFRNPLTDMDSWKGYVAARNASREQGHKLGKMFAERNNLEKSAYHSISYGRDPRVTDGVKDKYFKIVDRRYPNEDPQVVNENSIAYYRDVVDSQGNKKYDVIPMEHPVYAFGGQNAQYLENSLDIDSPQSAYEMRKSAKPIHYDKYGNPYVRGFTWTQTGNIPKITDPNSGYLATVGADTKNYHPHVKGQWTSEGWGNPMDKNYENGVRPGEVWRSKNFDEQLLETRWPLKFYQKAPFINQGGTQERVTVMGAGPGAKDVHRPIVGKDGTAVGTTVDKVATPSRMITAHMEENMPSEWTMRDWSNGGHTIAGFHPNKKWSDMNAKMFADEVRKLNPELYKEISKAYEDEYGLGGMELAANGPKFVGRWFLENPDKLEALKQSKVSDISRIMERGNELEPQYALIDRARANSLLDQNPSTPYEYAFFADNLPSRDVFAKGSMYRGEKPYTFSRSDDETPKSVMDFYKSLDAKRNVIRERWNKNGKLSADDEKELVRLNDLAERIEEDYGW